MTAHDLTGQKFTRLTVIRRGPRIRGQQFWWCSCACSPPGPLNFFTVRQDNLLSGKTTSCGCLKSTFLAPKNRDRGRQNRPEKPEKKSAIENTELPVAEAPAEPPAKAKGGGLCKGFLIWLAQRGTYFRESELPCPAAPAPPGDFPIIFDLLTEKWSRRRVDALKDELAPFCSGCQTNIVATFFDPDSREVRLVFKDPLPQGGKQSELEDANTAVSRKPDMEWNEGVGRQGRMAKPPGADPDKDEPREED